MSEKKSKAATELTYTEKEMEAIKVLEANKGSMLTADELGISGITLVGLAKKAEKVDAGTLANPNNLPVCHINKEKIDKEVTIVKPVTVYGLAD